MVRLLVMTVMVVVMPVVVRAVTGRTVFPMSRPDEFTCGFVPVCVARRRPGARGECPEHQNRGERAEHPSCPPSSHGR